MAKKRVQSRLMKEVLHPLFDYHFRPDLGGTLYDFSKEISKDKITYFVRSTGSVTRLAIPGDKSFLHISVETLMGDVFSEAFYSSNGDLVSANLWFTRYCDQAGFIENVNPSDDFLDIYDAMFDMGTEILLEADVAMQRLGVYYCYSESDIEEPDIISVAGLDIPTEPTLFKYHPDMGIDEDLGPVGLYVGLNDNVLNLGFLTSEKRVTFDTFSTVVNLDQLTGKSTPADIRRILESVYLKT